MPFLLNIDFNWVNNIAINKMRFENIYIYYSAGSGYVGQRETLNKIQLQGSKKISLSK